MDPTRFDQLSTRLAAGRLSRRRALRGRGAAALAPLAGIAGGVKPAAAARGKQRSRARHRGGPRVAHSGPIASRTLFRDNVIRGFDIGSPDSDRFAFSAGPVVGDDGEETTGRRGLRATAARFTTTIPQGGGPTGLPGGIDHANRRVDANRRATGDVGVAERDRNGAGQRVPVKGTHDGS